MKTAILTFEQFHGKKGVGSSRIRGRWVLNQWKNAGIDLGDAELFRYGVKYDAVIFQKAYFVEYAKAFKGVKILDICDPDWFDWSVRVMEMINEMDAITCPTLALAKTISNFTDKPVFVVPDRVDLSVLPAPKNHIGDTKTVVWYGYSQNFPVLDSAIRTLHDLKLDLIVVADNVYTLPTGFKLNVQNLPFSEASYMHDIQLGDVVLNPRHTKGKWKYKSENKTSIAHALGMPVAHDAEELKNLLTEEARKAEAERGLAEVREKFDVKLSVIDYKEIISDIAKTK